ncbi:MAG: hypothetical protein GVY14_12695 [Spirochaetes bacterium]|jgi:hypothetical protein|nr:hypothetical protein [Spirochaetota bacterium]
MPGHAVILEDSNGGRVADPSESQILSTVEQIGNSLDHCILHLGGDEYLQTAGERNRLFIEYSDVGGMFRSTKTDFDAVTVGQIFAAAMQGSQGWKREYVFDRTGAGAGVADGGTGAEAHSGGARASGTSVKDQLLDSVKKGVQQEASYGVGRMVRGLIRNVTRRR